MFGNTTIALLASLSFAVWVYTKTQRSTGNNAKTSLTVAGACALVGFLIIYSLLGLIPSN